MEFFNEKLLENCIELLASFSHSRRLLITVIAQTCVIGWSIGRFGLLFSD